jgi:hypothetical protein
MPPTCSAGEFQQHNHDVILKGAAAQPHRID